MAKFWKNLSRNQQIVVAIITSFTAIIVAFIGAGVFKLSPKPSCQVNASEITTERKVIDVNQTTKVSIRVDNPDGRIILYNWQTVNGQINPNTRSISPEAVYTAPSTPVDDTISVDITMENCPPVRRSKSVSVILPAPLPTPTAISTLLPADTPIPSTATNTATNIPTPSSQDDALKTLKTCNIPVTSAFKSLYENYKDYLGCATESTYIIPKIAEQSFQGGHLFWREDKNELYIIYDRLPDGTELVAGTWLKAPSEWQWDGSYSNGVGLSPPSDTLHEPVRGFGWIWRTHLGGPDGKLGWALDKEYGFNNLSKVQVFERGFLFQGSDLKTYCLLDSGEFFTQK